MSRISLFFLLLVAPAAACQTPADPAIEGYPAPREWEQRMRALERSEGIRVIPVGKSLLLEIGSEGPAILVVGSVHAPHVATAELCLRTAEKLAKKARREQVRFYFLPLPNPEGATAFYTRPYRDRDGNARKTDDDRDGTSGEDPPEDLNGDGWITMMRVEDESGKWMPHPQDPRILIEADPKKNEKGRYRLHTEGRDNDQDESFNEDAGDGVSFNRNFTFQYPYFKKGAGEHQVSEAETRAVADFCFSHPEIAAVFTFTPEDNLMHPWKSNSGAEKKRIKTTLLSRDEPYVKFIKKQYTETNQEKDAPSPPDGQGSFSEWAYFHFGRWSFAARGWWIPNVAEKKEEKDGEKEKKKEPEEKRGKKDINALRWFDREEIDGFVEWTPVEHPGFPGRKVEVGGFKPFFRLNPPAKELDAIAGKHLAFLEKLADLLPRIAIAHVRVENLSNGVHRVTATVVNRGMLPTLSEMGRISRKPFPLQIEITHSESVERITGNLRHALPVLRGNGGKAEVSWLLRSRKPGESVTLRAYSPSIGSASRSVSLKD